MRKTTQPTGSGNFDFGSMKMFKKTLTQKFLSPEKIQRVSIVKPIDIKCYYPDLGQPKIAKIVHKQKIYGLDKDLMI